MQQTGYGTISKLTERTVIPGLKHYKRFEKEIQEQLNTIPDPAVRAQPEAIEYAYKLVVGGHSDELMNEAIEADRRAEVRDGVKPGSPRGGGRGTTGTSAPQPGYSPKDLGWSEEQISMVESKGGLDGWSRRMSGGRYKNFQDYAKAHLKMSGKEVK
jgi:hypothetical protein